MPAPKPKPTLQERLAASVKAAAPSLAPTFRPDEPDKEIIPDLRELLDIPAADRNKLQGLITTSAEWQKAESEAKKARKPLTDQIKKLVSTYGLNVFRVGDVRARYYNAPRTSLSKEMLMQHGVSRAVIEACTVATDSWTLRISQPGQEEE